MSEKRKPLLQAAKFSVERIRREWPDGDVSESEIIVHLGAVVILPILEDGSWVMIRNRRLAVGYELLELPAGTMQPGEEPLVCARRELEEETGYRAESLELVCIFYSCPGISDERMHGFVARGLTKTAQRLEPDEHIRVEVMSPDKVLQLLRDGTIEDGKTIALLATYHLRENR